jgi:hypothetical protein
VSDLFVDAHGSGEHVVLAHGSLATGSEEWEAQQPLAEEGFRLLVWTGAGTGAARPLKARTSCATRRTSRC